MNGHGGKRKGAGAKRKLSIIHQIRAAMLCEQLQQRSSKRVTRLRLKAKIDGLFPDLYQNYRDISKVPQNRRYLVKLEDAQKDWTLELAQEARAANEDILQGNRIHSVPIPRGFKREQITTMVARIMSNRIEKKINSAYIDRNWKYWRKNLLND